MKTMIYRLETTEFIMNHLRKKAAKTPNDRALLTSLSKQYRSDLRRGRASLPYPF